MCLAQGRNAEPPVMQNPQTLDSRVKHSATTEPLRSPVQMHRITRAYAARIVHFSMDIHN